jgi:hypothetical protein
MTFKNCCPAWRIFSKSLMKHLKGFDSGFTEFHAKLDADMLIDFAIHRRQNKRQNRKSKCVKQCMFTARCYMAEWCDRFSEVQQ